jgi:hypothetical protein
MAAVQRQRLEPSAQTTATRSHEREHEHEHEREHHRLHIALDINLLVIRKIHETKFHQYNDNLKMAVNVDGM